MNPSQYYTLARVFSRYLAVFSKRVTGAARFFQEGTGPASFNINCVDIPPGYVCMRLLFLHADTFTDTYTLAGER